jgi:GntR family transcriptional regulator
VGGNLDPSATGGAVNALSSTAPLHERVRKTLENQIINGVMDVEDRLPSEAELERLYGVSRTPVRRALQDLEAAGLIYRAQGRGSFVRNRKIGGALRELISFGEELRRAGHVVEAKTLRVATMVCDETIAPNLRLEAGDEILHIRRLYLADGEPLAIFDHHLRAVVSIDTVKRSGDFRSLYELLSDSGVELWDASETIGATQLTGEDADLLNVDSPAAALLLKRASRLIDGTPIEFSVYRVRADRYEYQIHLRKGK